MCVYTYVYVYICVCMLYIIYQQHNQGTHHSHRLLRGKRSRNSGPGSKCSPFLGAILDTFSFWNPCVYRIPQNQEAHNGFLIWGLLTPCWPCRHVSCCVTRPRDKALLALPKIGHKSLVSLLSINNADKLIKPLCNPPWLPNNTIIQHLSPPDPVMMEVQRPAVWDLLSSTE